LQDTATLNVGSDKQPIMQTFISPIGFNTTSVTRSLLEHGIDSEDTVQLIRPATETNDNRATEAVEDVKRLLQEIEPKIVVHTESIPHNDFEDAVMTCSNLLRTAGGEVVVSLSGGARDVLLPLTVATMAHEAAITTTLGYSDIDGQVREFGLPSVSTMPSKGALETLRVVADANSSVTLPELSDNLEAVKSTITRHVSSLEDAGYVTSWIKERNKHVSITLSGRLCIAVV
jgi:CRISPR-associated protein Csa3